MIRAQTILKFNKWQMTRLNLNSEEFVKSEETIIAWKLLLNLQCCARTGPFIYLR